MAKYKVMPKKEIAEYQAKLDSVRRQIMYAESFTPHKTAYYRYILIQLLNEAPPQCR